MQETTFESLALNQSILSALIAAGYETPTEIQAAAIPPVLQGRDLSGTAQTGTGKTAAFVLPILHLLAERVGTDNGRGRHKGHRRRVRALILSPTRELAQQIEASVKTYGVNLPLKVTSVVGGLSIQQQIRRLQGGVDLLVATPGRLLDLLQRRAVDLRSVDFFVLDEADRMLDMGFVHDVQDIARRLPEDRQTLLFSATTSSAVEQLSRVLLNKPLRVEGHPPDTVVEKIEQHLFYVDRKDKRALVLELLERDQAERALVFTGTKGDSNVLAAVLSRKGFPAVAMHSDKGQRDRQKALREFESGSVRVLVATDVMARGIDVEGITHVINYDLPNDPENFLHRVGRTARAGLTGVAYSFCDLQEVPLLQAIERFIKEPLTLDENHSYHSPIVQAMKNQKTSLFGRRGRRGFGRRR